MPLETGIYVQDLDAANPAGSDDISLGDNHLRLIKDVVKNTLPNASKAFRFPSSGATKTSSFSVSFPSDQNVLFTVDSTSGAIAVTLPDPTSGTTANEDGFGFWLLMSAGANAITVSPAGGQTIMGASSYSLTVIKQWAYFFWAKTAAKWFVFDSNLASFAYAYTIALSGATPLTLRRTENNNTTEYETLSQQLGSGAGDKMSTRLFGDGSNGVAQIRNYLGSTELARWTTALALINIALSVTGAVTVNSLTVLDPSGFMSFTEISDPSSPAANVLNLYAKDDGNGTTRLAYKDSSGNVRALDRVGEVIAIIEDQKAQNTAGGTFTSGADQTRTLNTLSYNRDSLISINSNHFVLPAGTWEVQWSAPANNCNFHQSLLYNISDSAEVARGSSEFVNNTNLPQTRSVGSAVVTIAASKNYEIRHRCSTTKSTDGFGLASNFSTEVYTRVVIRRA